MVLSDIDLVIPSGKTTAVVGPSGSGKTTLCHLIPRFYETRSGSVKIDGTDIRDFEITSLRKNIGIVQQDVFLFAESIMENIRFGNPDADDEAVMNAAAQAEMHNYIMSLPNGYQTVVGERGVTLSGGQKQRISIARVFLKNPPILILDEATSSLDTMTENKIKESIERLSQGRTSVIIAHRLSTIRKADQIVYLNEKGIEEKGSHEELMKLRGAYYRLQTMQLD
jgi:ATP-binding cassette subfamily B protein